MIRFAHVKNARSAEELWRYLPENYTIVGWDIGEERHPEYIIAGIDDHGWTLNTYIIPRLASGLIFAEEVDLTQVAELSRLK